VTIVLPSPVRITLGDGGVDVASYYHKHEVFLIAAAIDKFVCIPCSVTAPAGPTRLPAHDHSS